MDERDKVYLKHTVKEALSELGINPEDQGPTVAPLKPRELGMKFSPMTGKSLWKEGETCTVCSECGTPKCCADGGECFCSSCGSNLNEDGATETKEWDGVGD